MNKTLFNELSIFFLLTVSKLSSTFINISPFLAVIVIGAYFVRCRYRFLIMIFIVQFFSDLTYGVHISNLFVYLSYFFVVLFLFRVKKIFSLGQSLLQGLYINMIFYVVTSLGHYLSFSDDYSINDLAYTYSQGLVFSINLILSTSIFIGIFHALLVVSRKRLAKRAAQGRINQNLS